MTLVTIGITLAIAVFTIYLQRLIVHGLPQGITIFSAFLPLGPLGQSGFAFLLLGQTSRILFPIKNGNGNPLNIFENSMTPEILYVISWVLAFALWSLATCWLLLALLALGDVLIRTRFPFTITFWGMIFPNGVYANLTLQLAVTLDSELLRIWGAVYAVFTFSLWCFATWRTLPSVWDGSIFEAPCLSAAQAQARPQEVEEMGEDVSQQRTSSEAGPSMAAVSEKRS